MRTVTLGDGTRCRVAPCDAAAPVSLGRGPADVTVLVTSDGWPGPRVMSIDQSWTRWPDRVVATAVTGRLAIGAWSVPAVRDP